MQSSNSIQHRQTPDCIINTNCDVKSRAFIQRWKFLTGKGANVGRIYISTLLGYIPDFAFGIKMNKVYRLK